MMVCMVLLVTATPQFDWGEPPDPGGVYLYVQDDALELTLERGVSTSLLPGTASFYWGYSDPVSGSEYAAWSDVENRFDMSGWASSGDYSDTVGTFDGSGWDVTVTPEPASLSAVALGFFCMRRSRRTILRS